MTLSQNYIFNINWFSVTILLIECTNKISNCVHILYGTGLTSKMKFFTHIDLQNLRFSVYSSADIKKLSVAKIVTPLVFDQLGHALPGGIYDPAMGI